VIRAISAVPALYSRGAIVSRFFSNSDELFERKKLPAVTAVFILPVEETGNVLPAEKKNVLFCVADPCSVTGIPDTDPELIRIVSASG
jgi:hypothetical protein